MRIIPGNWRLSQRWLQCSSHFNFIYSNYRMGSTRAQIEQKMCELTPKTKLDKKVIRSLLEVFYCHCGDKGLDRVTFRDYIISNFEILDDVILDRLFNSMDTHSNSQCLNVDDFVLGIAALLSRDKEELIRFCFKVYDSTGDGVITREKIYPFLKNALINKLHDADQDDAEEGIRELIDLAMKKLDIDGDGRVSFDDFLCAVYKDTLRMELLGKCLPDEKSRNQCLKVLGDPDLNLQHVTITSVRQEKRRHHHSRRHSASHTKCASVMQTKQ